MTTHECGCSFFGPGPHSVDARHRNARGCEHAEADAGLRAAWIEGWMQGAGQMTTWPPEALHSEAVRQFERRAALGAAQEKGEAG